MSNDQIILLHDFHYIIPPNGSKVTLHSGENYKLIEKKSDNWLAVTSHINDNVLFVPVSYIEFKRKPEYNSIKEKPPPPPSKPKNLLERLNFEVSKMEPPTISKEAMKELYIFLTGRTESVSSSSSPPVIDDPSNKPLLNHVSIESLDTVIQDEEQAIASTENCLELHPTVGDIPLNIFDDGVEMYRDVASGHVYYYNRVDNCASWTYPLGPDIPPPPISDSIIYSTMSQNKKDEAATLNGQNIFVPVEEETNQIHYNPVTISIDSTDIENNEIIVKSGYLNRTKINDNGRKIKKNWNTVYAVLLGRCLFFYKDQKASQNKPKHDLKIELSTAFVAHGNCSRSSRPNIIQLICGNGIEYLLQSSNAETMNDWFQKIASKSNFEPLTTNQISEQRDQLSPLSQVKSPDAKKKNRQSKKERESSVEIMEATSELSLHTIGGSDKSKFSDRLKSWLIRRPSRDSLREKGIYKPEAIFGSNLSTICEREKSSVPKFVIDCIAVVEARGLAIDGIYRVSGNMAEVQKLRFAINQNTIVNLQTTDLDIHVITGSLKLFFRELSEPLFPFQTFNLLIKAMGETENHLKFHLIKEAIMQMPNVNKMTAKELFRHFLLVVQHSADNRMHYQNISIVFGPTLMWPDDKSAATDLAVSMVMRGQLVEIILKNYSSIFGS